MAKERVPSERCKWPQAERRLPCGWCGKQTSAAKQAPMDAAMELGINVVADIGFDWERHIATALS
jgi:hypothetical protein